MTPEHQLLVSVQAAAKNKDPAAGVAAYHLATAAGTKIHPDLYSTLLYLCSGGDAWELSLRQQLTESTPLVEDIMRRAAADAAAQLEAAATAEAAQQAALSSPESSAATAVEEAPTAQTQAASPSVAANGNQHATAVAASPASKSPPACAEVPSVGAAMSTAGAGSTAHGVPGADASATAVEAASLPQLTPSQLREQGRAIFDHMQVKPQHMGHVYCYMCICLGQDPATANAG